MKKLLLILFILSSTFNVKAQELQTSQDSIKIFYDDIFHAMKVGYLYKENVNWNELESEIKDNLKQYDDFNSSLKEVKTIFDLTKADHSKVYYNEKVYSGNFEVSTIDDFSAEWVKKFKTDPSFEVKIINDDIGYILMPGIMYTDYSSENIHNIAQSMYDEISKVKSTNDIKGWIIDLRFNTGGNCDPMILALYDFLGNNDVWGVLDINKKMTDKIKLTNGKYKYNSKKSSYINPNGMLLDKAKVAILINSATGSSGEITALAFKGRENTIFIGERTNGKTTSNMMASLPFGAFMTLTIGLDSDRNGNYYEHIIPDIAVLKRDNFDDLVLDGNIQQALKFLTEKE